MRIVYQIAFRRLPKSHLESLAAAEVSETGRKKGSGIPRTATHPIRCGCYQRGCLLLDVICRFNFRATEGPHAQNGVPLRGSKKNNWPRGHPPLLIMITIFLKQQQQKELDPSTGGGHCLQQRPFNQSQRQYSSLSVYVEHFLYTN